MRFLITVILTALLSFLSGLIFPWWTVAIAALIIALILPQRGIVSFFAAFTGVFILWFLLAAYFDLRNQHLLSQRMSLLIFHAKSSWLLITVSAFIGALVAAMGGLCGSLIRRAGKRRKKASFGTFYGR